MARQIDQNVLRSEFPLTEQMMYFDVAYHNVLPSSVADAMSSFIRDEWQHGGFPPSWGPMVHAAREKYARLIGADPAEIAFMKNTADGINTIANALPLHPGDNVIINSLEHASNFFPWRNLSRNEVQVRVVQAVDGRVPTSALLSAVDRRTRAIAISAVQYRTGFRADLAALGTFCRSNGIYLIADAIQAIGTLEFDVENLAVDAVACGAHKGLLGPYGIGGLYVRKELIKDLVPGHLAGEGVAHDSGAEDLRLRDDARRFEVGNHNYLGLTGLSAALDLLLDVGINTIQEQVQDLASYLVEGLLQRDITIVSPREQHESSGIVVFDLPTPEDAVTYFETNGARISLRDGKIRASFHMYNSRAEIDRFLALIDSYLRKH